MCIQGRIGMTQNNIKIAVTGGIGSGKSTVLSIIGNSGYPVFSCDEIYKELLEDKKFIDKIEEEFGNILSEDGKLDRQKLSAMVFGDFDARQRLDSITHPEIMRLAFEKMSLHRMSFLEVPLLFESGFEKIFDKVIVVLRDKEERIKSIIQRSGLRREEAVLRIKSQFDYDNFDFAEYYVIHNDCSKCELAKKTLNLIGEITSIK